MGLPLKRAEGIQSGDAFVSGDASGGGAQFSGSQGVLFGFTPDAAGAGLGEAR